MPFGPVDPDLDLVALEERVLARWRDDDIDRPGRAGSARTASRGSSTRARRPPTAGPACTTCGPGSSRTSTPASRPCGATTCPARAAGTATACPVELEVEKELGPPPKHEIEAYGIAEFNQRCRESVHRYVEDWSALTARSGMWIDTADAYWTLDQRLHRVGVVAASARCGTRACSTRATGSAPTAPAAAPPCRPTRWASPGYRDVVDPSVYVRFPLADGPAADADLLVWTTTPWTLISNVAAAVGPDIDYVRVADPDGGRDLVMAERPPPAATRSADGRRAAGRAPSSSAAATSGRSTCSTRRRADGRRVVAADFVTTDDGSGIVHLAPAFGEDDAAVGRAEGLPVLNPVDADGAFDDRVAAVRRAGS